MPYDIHFENGLATVVRVNHGVKSMKCIKVSDLMERCAEIGRQQEQDRFVKTPLLPPNTLTYWDGTQSVKIVLWLPSARWTIHWMADRGTGQVIDYPNAMMPDMLHFLRFEKRPNNQGLALRGSVLAAVQTNIFREDLPLYYPILPNIFQGGGTCWGNNFRDTVPGDRSNSDRQNLAQIKEAIRFPALFLGSRFNQDIPPRFNGNAIPGHAPRGVSSGSYAHLLSNLAEATEFPGALLQPLNTTLRQVLESV